MRVDNHHYERWARWVHQGCLFTPQRSILGVMIDEKGMPPRSEGGSKPLYQSCVEADIEAAAMQLARTEPQAVVVLRLEFGATRIARLNDKPTQRDKAHAIGVSLRTYQNRLKRAKTFINETVR